MNRNTRNSACPSRTWAMSPGKIGWLFFWCTAALLIGDPAHAVEGYPGSTWGRISHTDNGLTGSGGMGYIRQGIDWTTLPAQFMLNTYAEYRYRARTKQNDYYDAQGPAVGIEVQKSMFSIGAAYYWERFPRLGTQSNTREFYFKGYYDWDLMTASMPHPFGMLGLPGSCWWNITRDITGLTGSGIMGYVNQGIDWVRLPGGIMLNTYAEYRYRNRTKEEDYYDAQGPALGIELRKAVFRLGADYYWEQFPKLGERSNYLEFYLTWYVDWDLKPRVK